MTKAKELKIELTRKEIDEILTAFEEWESGVIENKSPSAKKAIKRIGKIRNKLLNAYWHK